MFDSKNLINERVEARVQSTCPTCFKALNSNKRAGSIFPPSSKSFRLFFRNFEFSYIIYFILDMICIVSISINYYLMTQSVFQSKLIENYLRSSQTAVSMLPCTDWFLLTMIDSHKVLFFTGNSAHLQITKYRLYYRKKAE